MVKEREINREKNISILKPSDMHIHLRQDAMLNTTVRDAAKWFCQGVVMPNTLPPINTPESLCTYRKKISSVSSDFNPVMSFKLYPDMTEDAVKKMAAVGAKVGKLYPAGATTNSEDGVKSWHQIKDALAAMCNLDLVLSIHCEKPDAFCMEREFEYHSEFREIARAFPSLRIVFEHISDRRSIDLVASLSDKIAATITAHHLLLTLDDVIGGNMNPHNFCKPVVKTPLDRDAIREAAFSGNKKFFFGSDSAPHLRVKKESGSAGGGIYSAPAAVPLVARLFDEFGKLDKLENFMSVYGPDFYRIPHADEKITIRKETFTIPLEIDGIVPLFAGKIFVWKN